MLESNPNVSVAMAVYNSAPYLREAVESILNQSLRDFEFLIIDDGSTDDSLTILRHYAAQDGRIRLTSQVNSGIARTRNQLLRQAKGEFVAVMDADDVAMPERFAQQVAFLHANPDVVCVGGAYDIVDSEGIPLTFVQFPEIDAEIQQRLITGVTALHHPCSMFRRAIVLQMGGYNESMTASIDLDLWLRLGEIGRLANLPHKVLNYRIHPNSVSERRSKRQGEDARKACQRAWERRGIQGSYQVSDAWRHPLVIEYGRRMFRRGHRVAAIQYGIRAVKLLPFDMTGWKLLIGSLIKPLPPEEHR